MTLRSVWLENKYENKLISAQCILTGKHGCRRFGSMAKRIVNFISDARTILLFPYSYGYTGNIFLATAKESLDVYFGQSYSSVGHQYTLVGQTINLNSMHLAWTECPTVSSPRRTISRMGRTMSVTDRYFKA